MTLLDVGDVARIFGCGRKYCRDVLVKHPDFPRPVIAISQKLKKWDEAHGSNRPANCLSSLAFPMSLRGRG